jgi:hypothetical protein
MSLVLSTSPQNNPSTQNVPQYQDWGPSNNESVYVWSNANPGTLLPVAVQFKIKDVIGVPEYSQYSQFRLAAYQTYNETAPIWLAPLVSPGYPQIYISPIAITTTGLTYNYTPSFQNLALMAVGNYSFTHHFIIQGKNSSNNWIDISSYNYTTRLVVTNQTVTVTPNTLSFVHYQNTTLPYQDITITGNNWKLQGNLNFVLSSTTPGVTVTNIGTGSNQYQTVSGSGTATIRVTLGTFYDSGFIDPYNNTVFFAILQGVSTLIGYVTVNVQVFNQGTFNVSPRHLDFYAVYNIQEAAEQYVLASSSAEPFTITASPWLMAFLDNRMVDGVLIRVLVVVPIPTINMIAGIYNGTVVLDDVIAGVPSQITITVTYTIDGFFVSPYSNNLGFTLDPIFFNFSTTNLDTFFQLVATIKTFDFFSNTPKETILTEKLPLFNGRGKLNYGKVVHRLMNRFSAPNENEFQYKLPEFSLNIQEINITDLSVIRSAFFQGLKFIAGLSRALVGNFGFLDFNQKADRVTVNSFYYLNIYIPLGNYEIRVYKNNVQIDTIPLPVSDGKIIFKKVTFATFRQGDVIQYTLNIPSIELPETPLKKFYVIPSGRYSNHIIWENEYLLQSAFEFTGGAAIKSDFENRTQSLYKNLTEILEIIENTKINKISINTGWIIKDSIDTIESLMRSKRAWLPLADKTIELRPLSKTMVNQDTERELIDYTIEFQINRQYNEETYSL